MTTYFAEQAHLPSGLAQRVRLTVQDGRFTGIEAEAVPDGAVRLPGVVFPGFANAHSHAFHRALRGRTHDDGGTFWTWRERMYALAARLTPETYLALARATYAEMAAAGITAVGEFHYLHHGPGGVPYAEPNVMAEALTLAAAEAGVRLTLLDACYLTGGLSGAGHLPLDPVQLRFADADVDHWESRVGALSDQDGRLVGAAIHSVRSVPESAVPIVAAAAAGRPLHVHVSEQPAENEASQAFYGRSPVDVLGDAGAWGPHSVAVHATHVSPVDVDRLASTATTVCMCPTTERDLADGVAPTAGFRERGVRLALGSDQQAVIDLFEEARAVEMDERLVTLHRGRHAPSDLLAAMCNHSSIGWPDAGRLEVGARADLVAVRTDSSRTAGVPAEQMIFAASAADVDTVVTDGRTVVTQGEHVLGPVGVLLASAVETAWQDG